MYSCQICAITVAGTDTRHGVVDMTQCAVIAVESIVAGTVQKKSRKARRFLLNAVTVVRTIMQAQLSARRDLRYRIK